MSDESRGRAPVMPAGWYDDPTSIGEARYWDGYGWTTSINTRGVTSTAGIEPSLVGVPPTRGSEFRAHRVPAPTPAPVTVNQAPQTPRSPVGAIVAGVIGLAVIIALVVLLTRDDGGDTPPPDTGTPITTPITESPVTEPTPTGG